MKIIKIAAVLLSGLLTFSMSAAGKWGETPAGLPYYSYEGLHMQEGDDPAFLLGNYRLNLKTHASGLYQLISGERMLARFNADPERPEYGKNRATVTFENQSVELAGLNSVASDPMRCVVETGVGFTRYDYRLDNDIRCTRMISVMPSEAVNDGKPCFLVTVTFSNMGKSAVKMSYVEAVSPGYIPISEQAKAPEERAMSYPMLTEVSFRCLKAMFAASPQHFLRFPSPEARSHHEVAPQSVFLYADNAFLSINEGELKATFSDFRLRPGAKRTFQIVIGFSGEDDKAMGESMVAAAIDGKYGAYEHMWKKCLPDYSSERERNVRRELYWNAHMLESSAMYDSYFDETFVPAGSDDTYAVGMKISNREHLDAVLPLCYSNPELAKSALRYVMKHMDFDGRLYDGNKGFGCVVSGYDEDYLNQTDLLHTVAEYLRITGDHAFLDERLIIYPMASGEFIKVSEVLERCFIYLREMYGQKGNDAIAFASVYPVIESSLKESGKASAEFLKALKSYNGASVSLLSTNLEVSVADLDQQIVLLNGSYIETAGKRKIYDSLIDSGIIDGIYDMDPEILYSLIAGIATFDALDARSMLRKCTERNLDGEYPGHWSDYSVHPYAWPLYCHYRMSE